MPRNPRIHYPGALYHVVCRGNNREWIFRSEMEKQEYLERIAEYKRRYGFNLYAWVLMSNHAHLLIEVRDVSLSKIMQGIQQGYTQWYNRRHKHTGHVFEQRYKATLCNKDQYLLALIRYIHQNPERAKLESGLDYLWSSHKSYIGENKNGITDISFPLGLFSEDTSKAQQNYLAYMGEEEELIGTLKPGEYEEGTQDNETQAPKRLVIKRTLSEIIEMTAAEYGLETQAFYGKSRSRKDSEARKALILICLEHTFITSRGIAKELGLSDTAITKMITRGLEDQRDRKEKIAKLSHCQA